MITVDESIRDCVICGQSIPDFFHNNCKVCGYECSVVRIQKRHKKYYRDNIIRIMEYRRKYYRRRKLLVAQS